MKVKGAGDAGVEWAVPMNVGRFLTSCAYVSINAKSFGEAGEWKYNLAKIRFPDELTALSPCVLKVVR